VTTTNTKIVYACLKQNNFTLPKLQLSEPQNVSNFPNLNAAAIIWLKLI